MTRGFRRRLRADTRGMALVEFAMLLPIMLTLFLGGFQLVQASSCQRQVTIVARAIADLVSRHDTLNAFEVQMILGASSKIMAFSYSAPAQSRVSLIKVDAGKIVTVVWSEAYNMPERPLGSFDALPANMRLANSYYILSEVNYNYNPIGGWFAWPITFTQSLFMVPRKSTYVDCSTCMFTT